MAAGKRQRTQERRAGRQVAAQRTCRQQLDVNTTVGIGALLPHSLWAEQGWEGEQLSW